MDLIRKKHFCLIAFFTLVILSGTLLLKMPFVSHSDGISWADAIFTATGATCVTNMCNLSTSGFNLPGQLIILLLLQVGGLGTISLAASIVLMLRGINAGENIILGAPRNISAGKMERLLRTVMLYTFTIEGIGFILLTGAFWFQGIDLLTSAYYGLFHSVSAFCNAGFTPFDNSMITAGWTVKLIISFLVIAGGLGFYAIFDIWGYLHDREKPCINTKIILITSVVLIVGGTLIFKLLERSNISWLDSYFMVVSSRSAGFFSVIPSSMHSNSIIIIMFMMLIGCSPGSTGGGIRNVAAAMIFLAIFNAFKGNTKMLLFKREIPLRYVLKSFAVAISFFLTATSMSLITAAAAELPLNQVGFEVVSALTNCGMPWDIKEYLLVTPRTIIACCMFLGRIGPMTIFLFFLRERSASRLSYPKERVIIG
ncbi:MAG: potassium transporter TrkG [Victivallaceae bacterium]|jgi:trk system potassium uptake protein TrkH|nr:potassium transporter TrkG [Victivallaceae bacterium]NLK83689.1 hypothetical protein [Lentisphaerota bacterium]MDD3117504.1 potassium transporter TrkG [Victivallaceae bacterium]MDD3703537.1 potassium transporter TrkG [Victivallaceae bacterium]MDD4317154.1 potassium transporter TrkG [Victivallaceae bacterium]